MLFLSPSHTLPLPLTLQMAHNQVKQMMDLLKMDGMTLALLCKSPHPVMK
jgi:hypothetical protein